MSVDIRLVEFSHSSTHPGATAIHNPKNFKLAEVRLMGRPNSPVAIMLDTHEGVWEPEFLFFYAIDEFVVSCAFYDPLIFSPDDLSHTVLTSTPQYWQFR